MERWPSHASDIMVSQWSNHSRRQLKMITKEYFDSRSDEELRQEVATLLGDTKTYYSAEEVKRDARRAFEIQDELKRRQQED